MTRPWVNPRTGQDEPGIENWRDLMPTMGPDFGQLPSAWWGRDDWAAAEARNRPLNLTLPPAPPDRVLPAGFSLFPDKQQPPLTKGQKAVAEIRQKLGR